MKFKKILALAFMLFSFGVHAIPPVPPSAAIASDLPSIVANKF